MRDHRHEMNWAICIFSHDCYHGLFKEILAATDLQTYSKLLPVISRSLAQARANYEQQFDQQTTTTAPADNSP